jgi:hypothetical protein
MVDKKKPIPLNRSAAVSDYAQIASARLRYVGLLALRNARC